MPNPPTPEELEGWEKTAERLWKQSSWSANEEGAMVQIVRALLAEVKRLREENAKITVWYAEAVADLGKSYVAEVAASTPRTTPRL